MNWREQLRSERRRWLVTGAAGFIGSHVVEQLLAHGQEVRGLDNFATGKRENLFPECEFIEGDIRDAAVCARACAGVDLVLHQAALGSVPRSIAHPAETHAVNVDGFVHMALAARDAGVKRFVYASSSSVYGDEPTLPKVEARIGTPLSPYAVTKRVDEIYAETFQRNYGLACVGLRYFNVFGARQDPNGPYAAVMPRWFAALAAGEACIINGDGETSRDFCYVLNAVQANVLAALAPKATGVYNVAFGARTTLRELHDMIRARVGTGGEPRFADFRAGDIRHSLADISRARAELGYAPEFAVAAGLDEASAWYKKS
jgi:UDP-N-acetylglucosamine 4-epimerase